MANYSSDRDRRGNDPRQRAGSQGTGYGRDYDVRPEDWGEEWGEDWRGQDEVRAGGPWYQQEAPAGQARERSGSGSHGYGAADMGGQGHPYSQGYGGYDPQSGGARDWQSRGASSSSGSRASEQRGGEGRGDPSQGQSGAAWRDLQARDQSRRGGQPAYGGGYFGSSEGGGQSFSGGQRIYPGDPGYRSRTSEGYGQGFEQRRPSVGSQVRQRPVGPKGYKRSDERICEDVCERLADSEHVDVREVTVDVGSGVVTLGGTVTDRRSKYAIEEIADEVFGVVEVQNNIRVTRGSGSGTGSGTGSTGGAASSTYATGSEVGGDLKDVGGSSQPASGRTPSGGSTT